MVQNNFQVSIKDLKQDKFDDIENHFKNNSSYKVAQNNTFSVKIPGVTITGFKGTNTILFQGPAAKNELERWVKKFGPVKIEGPLNFVMERLTNNKKKYEFNHVEKKKKLSVTIFKTVALLSSVFCIAFCIAYYFGFIDKYNAIISVVLAPIITGVFTYLMSKKDEYREDQNRINDNIRKLNRIISELTLIKDALNKAKDALNKAKAHGLSNSQFQIIAQQVSTNNWERFSLDVELDEGARLNFESIYSVVREIKKTDDDNLDYEEIVQTVDKLQSEIDEAIDYLEKYIKIQSSIL